MACGHNVGEVDSGTFKRAERSADTGLVATFAEQRLMTSGRHVLPEESEQRKALSSLIAANDETAISSLLKDSPGIRDLHGQDNGQTPLYEAVVGNRSDLVKALVQAGAPIDAQQEPPVPLGSTPWAVALGPPSNWRIVDLLVRSPSVSSGTLARYAEDVYQMCGNRNLEAYTVYENMHAQLKTAPKPMPDYARPILRRSDGGGRSR